MKQSQYKSNAELKYLARGQMGGRFGLLIGAALIPLLISFFLLQLILTSNFVINYVLTFAAQLLLSVLSAGASLIYLKSACSMPAQISDLLYGYKNHLKTALKIGLLFVVIDSICMIPCDIMDVTVLSAIQLTPPEITEATTLNEMMEFYSVFYSVMGSYYLLALSGSLVAFLLKLVFVPAYYVMLDFPEWGAMKVLKTSVEIMRGNKLRYVLLQLSFLPMLILSVFTCGLTMIWVSPYIHMTNTNFYLDVMAVRNRNINRS